MAADAMKVREEMMELYKRAGVSPASPLLGSLIQLPVVMSCFLGIRRLCETVPSMSNIFPGFLM